MKKKRNYLRLLTIMLAVVSCIVFASCGGDNNEDEEVFTVKENNALLGGWKEIDLYMVLMKNGKMLYYKDNQDVKEGNWNYNEKTGILATDVDNYQWMVNLISENSWAGIRLWNQKTANAKREIALTAGILLASRTWTFKELERNYHFYAYSSYKSNRYYSPYVTGSGTIRLTDVSEDRSKDVITIKYQGDIYEIHHPYNYDSIYLSFPSGNKYYPKK